MSAVIPIFGRCVRCQVPRERTKRTIFMHLCDPCVDATVAVMVTEHRALVAAGVDVHEAYDRVYARHPEPAKRSTPAQPPEKL